MKHRVARLWARQQIVTGALLVSAGVLLGLAVFLLDVPWIIPSLEVSARERSLVRIALGFLLVLGGVVLGMPLVVRGQMTLMAVTQRAMVGDIHRRLKRLESKLDRQETDRFASKEGERRKRSREAGAPVTVGTTRSGRAQEQHEPVT